MDRRPLPIVRCSNGKTITYIVATGPGGGYDSYGRLIAHYLQIHLPGSQVLVRNVPDRRGLRGLNEIYAAKPDGLTIGIINSGAIYDQLVGREGAKFNLAKMTWLGNAASDTRALLVSTESGFKSFDDLLRSAEPVRVAANEEVGSDSYIETRIVGHTLHINMKLLSGFVRDQGQLSMLRNEVTAQIGTADSAQRADSMQQFVDAGHGFWAVLLSGAPTTFPGVPMALDYVTDDRDRRLLSLVRIRSDLARPTVAPPAISTPVSTALRKAFMTVMRDDQFIADAGKLKLSIDPSPGEVAERKIKQALSQPAESIDFLKQAAAEKE